MQGNPQVIDYFKDLLRGELAARDQYFIHSRIYEDQGFVKLYERLNHEMEEETQHADALLRRILFLGGLPDMRPREFTPGTTVPEMLRKDLDTEYEVRAALQTGVHLCESVRDYVSRDILPRAAQGHGRRPRLLAREAAGPDRSRGPAELPAVADRPRHALIRTRPWRAPWNKAAPSPVRLFFARQRLPAARQAAPRGQSSSSDRSRTAPLSADITSLA